MEYESTIIGAGAGQVMSKSLPSDVARSVMEAAEFSADLQALMVKSAMPLRPSAFQRLER
jgi:hypothetical protein